MGLIAFVIFLYSFSGQINGWLFTKDLFEVCYGSLGCFSSRYPFTNTPAVLPRSPSSIGTKFLLVTRDNNDTYETNNYEDSALKTGGYGIVDSVEPKAFDCKGFKHDRMTKILVHGYIHTVDEEWVRKMVSELLKHADYNVLLVDWREGSGDFNYMQAAANTRVVGAQIAHLLKALRQHCELDLSEVHIIGHSLGAHTAGHAGARLPGIGRITGLDPAGPLFEDRDPAVRLDPGDAVFVDVIHTDAEQLFNLGFGLKTPSGHVDFYPNGGMDQPGCPSTYFAQLGLLFKGNFDMIHIVACSHLRAVKLFTESINSNCTFQAFPCPVINRRTDETCTKCNGACASMGLHTSATTPSGKYSLRTKSTSPFCFDGKKDDGKALGSKFWF